MRRGYILAEAMIAVIIVGVVAAAFTAMSYYAHIESNLLKLQNTKIMLDIVRSRLLQGAVDVDNDSFFELPKENNGSTLPVLAGITGDAWGRTIYYATRDYGDANDANSSYADSNASISPNANVMGRLISKGEDGVLQTGADDAQAQQDDILLEIGVGEANHFKLYGGSEISSETRNYNSAIVSNTEPANPANGTLWFDTNVSKMKMYNQTDDNWTQI